MTDKVASVFWDGDYKNRTIAGTPPCICQLDDIDSNIQLSGLVDSKHKDLAFEALDVLEAMYPGDYQVVVMDFDGSGKEILSYDGIKYTWLNS